MFKFRIKKSRGVFRILIGLRFEERKRFVFGGLANSDYVPLTATAYAQLFKGEHGTQIAAVAELRRLQNFMCERGHNFRKKSLRCSAF